MIYYYHSYHHLASPLGELPGKALGPPQLRGADRRVVSRVREQDGPAALGVHSTHL